jgi:hypothetical protein
MSRRVSGARRLTMAAVLTSALALIGPPIATAGAAPAAAEPATTSVEPATTSVEPASVGLPAIIDLASRSASEQVTFPGVAGLRWSELRVRVQWPLTISTGLLEAADASGRIAALHSPANLSQNQIWTIPLRAPSDTPITLTFTSSLRFPGFGVCGPVFEGATVDIRPLSLRATRTRYSSRVGSYLAGPFARLVLLVPQRPTRDVAEAALRLTAAIVASDLNRAVHVSVVPVGTPLHGIGPSTRVVSLDPERPAGIGLTAGGLVIGGRGTGLDNQIDLVTGLLAPLLQTQSASAISVPGVPLFRGDTLTLSQLGVAPPAIAGAGTFVIPIGFDEAQAGGELRAVEVDLHGTNVAIPRDASATATLLAAGAPVATTVLGSRGNWQLEGAVPPLAVTRNVDLAVQITYTDAVGRCVDPEPLLVGVDPASTVTVARGRPPTPPGFDEAPQALVPRTTVVLARLDTAFLDAAANLLAGVQRMTSVPLDLTLAASPRLSTDGTPQLVVADPGSPLDTELRPAAVTDGRAVFSTPGGATVLAGEPTGPLLTFGHLANDTPVIALLAPTADLSPNGGILRALDDAPDRWFALSGDTAAVTPGGAVATAQVAGPLTATLTGAGLALAGHPWIWAAAGALATLAVAFVTRVLRVALRRRAGQRRPPL